MGARGPKSQAELALVQNQTTSYSRLQPPQGLTQFESHHWISVVDSRPADWFTVADIPTLTQYVRHVSTAETIAQQIKAMKPAFLTTPEGLDRYDKLSKMQERESRAMSKLLTQMRCTQQATYNAKNANTLKNSNISGPAPWEVSDYEDEDE